MNDECRKFESLLPDYRWLNAAERQAFDRHLASCAECREEFRQVQAVGEWFTQARTPAPTGLADGVMAALDHEARTSAPNRLVVPALVGLLAVQIALAVLLQVSPSVWWNAVAGVSSRFMTDWVLPAFAGAAQLLDELFASSASLWPASFNVALWSGALLVVVLFGWVALGRGRTERA